MMPSQPMVSLYSGDTQSFADQLRKQDAAWKAFAQSIRDVLTVCFPEVLRRDGFLHDNIPVNKVFDHLRDRLVDLMCCGTEEQLKRLETPPTFSMYGNTAEVLIRLTQQRDNMQSQIDQMEAALERADKAMGKDGIGSLLDASMIMPMRLQLDSINEQISNVQAELEKQQDKS